MVVDTHGRRPDLGGWFADLCSELADSSFYLHIVLKKKKTKTNLFAGIIYPIC